MRAMTDQPPVPSAVPAAAGAERPGLRERNKLEKLARIREGAYALFTEKGYDEATLRQIAERADVGLGTLFSYASDKRDLLFLLVNDDLTAMTASAFDDVDPSADLLDQLVTVFTRFYAFFGAQRELSKCILREMYFYSTGPEAQKLQADRQRVIERLTILLDAAGRDGRMRGGIDGGKAANAVFSIYATAIRRWLGDNSRGVEDGIAELKDLFELLLNGIGPVP